MSSFRKFSKKKRLPKVRFNDHETDISLKNLGNLIHA